MVIYTEPKVTLVAWPKFETPSHLNVRWLGDSVQSEKLVEFAGRVCYMSQNNPADKTTEDYISNIIKQQHGSVLEHANFTFLIEQVSRSLTHELVRHRAGFAYSQLSQRYVDETDVGFVVPPAIQEIPECFNTWVEEVQRSAEAYHKLVTELYLKYEGESTLMRRKRAREAARSLLPNCTETKIVVTGNARAWRHFIEMRANVAADREIQALALRVWAQLNGAAPLLFKDLQVGETGVVSNLGTRKV